MSATQESLAESLRLIDLKIVEVENLGNDTTELKEQKQELLQQFAQVNALLQEGVNILKG